MSVPGEQIIRTNRIMRNKNKEYGTNEKQMQTVYVNTPVNKHFYAQPVGT
jgi:hypothetical protein